MLAKKRINMVAIILVLAAVMMTAVACSPQAPIQGQQPVAPVTGAGTVTVVGQGEAFGAPDQAQVQVGVETFAPTVAEATTQNQATVDAIMAALEAQGIAKDDIQTSNYSLWAEQIYGDKGPEGIAGYRVSNQVNVKIRDINKVGDVLAAVTEAGANTIYGVSFTVSDPDALEEEARAAAMADARRRAEELAALGGAELGEIRVISEIIGQPAPIPLGAGGNYAVAEAAAAPSISPGQLSYQAQVQVSFELK